MKQMDPAYWDERNQRAYPAPLAGVREILLAVVDSLRADVARAMSSDQARAAWFRERDVPTSKRMRAIYERRGHGYAAVLAVALQIEARADRFAPAAASDSHCCCCGDHRTRKAI